MTTETLKAVKAGMEALGLNYAFVRWEGDVVYPYWVGEYQETPANSEDGLQESTFILTGHTRGSWLDLEAAKEKIENYFNRINGHRVIAENGTAVAIFYERSLVIPTLDAELKRMEINLLIKEWKVN